MNSIHFDVCCPSDEKLAELWISNFEHEKNLVSGKISKQELVLKNISNLFRLSIIHYVSLRPHCVCEIVKKLETPHSNISYHLSQLCSSGIVETYNNNGRVYYTVTEFGRSIINWLEHVPKGPQK